MQCAVCQLIVYNIKSQCKCKEIFVFALRYTPLKKNKHKSNHTKEHPHEMYMFIIKLYIQAMCYVSKHLILNELLVLISMVIVIL